MKKIPAKVWDELQRVADAAGGFVPGIYVVREDQDATLLANREYSDPSWCGCLVGAYSIALQLLPGATVFEELMNALGEPLSGYGSIQYKALTKATYSLFDNAITRAGGSLSMIDGYAVLDLKRAPFLDVMRELEWERAEEVV